MSQADTAAVTAAAPRRRAAEPGARDGRRRPGVVIVLVVSLVLAGAIREGAMAWQRHNVPGFITAAHGELGSMNSFALGLLLGGLRGPLGIFLWASSG